jgi:hypothetical protein
MTIAKTSKISPLDPMAAEPFICRSMIGFAVRSGESLRL